MPFSSFLDYLQLEKKYSSHTLKAYAADLEEFHDFLKSDFEEEDPLKVNYSQIRSWIVRLSENGISNRSINRKISSLKAYYRYLLKTHQIDASPLSKHRALKTSKKVQIPFSEKEIIKVLDNIDDSYWEGLRNKLIVELFYSTGMRRSELLNLKENDVDTESGVLKVLGKRNKERLLPILPSVKETIENYRMMKEGSGVTCESDYLFIGNNGDKLTETFVYRIINNYFSQVSGKVKKSPHILRHSFATHLLNQGANLNAVKELLGHSSLAATQVYTHNSIAELTKIHRQAHPRSNKD